MFYLFENLENATQARNIINQNMGYDGITNNYDDPRLINNPENSNYNKAILLEVEGDEYHHALWMTGIDGVIQYSVVEYNPDWFLPEEP